MATPEAGTALHVNFFDIAKSSLIKKSETVRTYDMVLNEAADAMYIVGPKKIAKRGIVADNS